MGFLLSVSAIITYSHKAFYGVNLVRAIIFFLWSLSRQTTRIEDGWWFCVDAASHPDFCADASPKQGLRTERDAQYQG
jgi:hypothetical protein